MRFFAILPLATALAACAGDAVTSPNVAPRAAAAANVTASRTPAEQRLFDLLAANAGHVVVLPNIPEGVFIRLRPVDPPGPESQPRFLVDGSPVPGYDLAALHIRPEQVVKVEVLKRIIDVERDGTRVDRSIVLITLKHDR